MTEDKLIIIGIEENNLLELLKTNYTNKIIKKINKNELNNIIKKENEIIITSSSSSSNSNNNNNNNNNNNLSEEQLEIKRLQKLLNDKDNQIKEMEVNTKLAVESIQTFHHQQQALYDEFLILRQKYDDQKSAHIATLWTYCASYHPDLSFVPSEESKDFTETETQVGRYNVTEMLGEGQFAIVYSCQSKGYDEDLAIKVINKDRITSFSSLRRVSNEISILKSLNSPYIIKIIDVIHTKTKLYIITEKGGQDLFEFFDEHPEGVKESWAQEITAGILTGVLYCHVHGVCHRDLKPENLLLKFDQNNDRLIDIKLCDFGLSTRYTQGEYLTDFCGSPGFFAPEMIINGSYLGDKVDIWSIGCILLELLLGHERFCDLWMGSYDYEIMQDKRRFTDEIQTTIARLQHELPFSTTVNQYIRTILQLDALSRPSAGDLCRLDWMKSKLNNLPNEYDMKYRNIHPSQNHSQSHRPMVKSPSHPNNMLKAAMSNRERQMLQEYGKQANHKGEVNLPPIEPGTPSLSKARKIMKQGEQLVKRAHNIDSNHNNEDKIQSHDGDDDNYEQNNNIGI